MILVITFVSLGTIKYIAIYYKLYIIRYIVNKKKEFCYEFI